MIDPVQLCERRGGVARTRELRTDGASTAALAAAVAAGLLVKPRQGLFALPSVGADVLDALQHGGVVACVTAARRHRLWVLDEGADEPTHTWVHPDRHPREDDAECAAVHHRDRPVGTPGLWIVSLLHCLIQIAWCRGAETFIAALESALRQHRLSTHSLALLRLSVPAPMRWLIDYARADADSGLESIVRYRLDLLGITVRTQVRIGGVGIVDFIIGDCLILEADGGTHDGPARHADRMRDAAAMALGFVTLRFDSAMVLHDWEVVEAAILAALDRTLHRSPASLRRDATR